MAAVAENGNWIPRDFKERFSASYPIKLDPLIIRDGTLVSPCRIYSGWSSANKVRRFISDDCEPILDDGSMLRYFLDRNGVLNYRREGREAHFVSTLLRNLGSTEKDKNEIERMGLKFDYPKPRKLISYLISLYALPGDLILDAFAGSGTTGHAVLSMGIEGLHFILIEMDKHNATQVVAPRMRMAINGYTPITGKNRKRIEGLGGGFQFCTLSNEPLFTADGEVRKDVRFDDLAEFIWFSETGSGRTRNTRNSAKSPLLGIASGKAVFLLYNGILGDRSDTGGNVLNGRMLEVLKQHAGDFDGPWVVYGARTRFDATRLSELQITFKQLPYRLKDLSWA